MKCKLNVNKCFAELSYERLPVDHNLNYHTKSVMFSNYDIDIVFFYYVMLYIFKIFILKIKVLQGRSFLYDTMRIEKEKRIAAPYKLL